MAFVCATHISPQSPPQPQCWQDVPAHQRFYRPLRRRQTSNIKWSEFDEDIVCLCLARWGLSVCVFGKMRIKRGCYVSLRVHWFSQQPSMATTTSTILIFILMWLIHPLSTINSEKDFLFYFQLRNNRVENDLKKLNKALKLLSLIVSQRCLQFK